MDFILFLATVSTGPISVLHIILLGLFGNSVVTNDLTFWFYLIVIVISIFFETQNKTDELGPFPVSYKQIKPLKSSGSKSRSKKSAGKFSKR